MLDLTVTLARAKQAQACADSYARALEIWGDRGPDAEIPLVEVLDRLGIADAIWALRIAAPVADRDRIARLFAADCAEYVLPLYERRCAGDLRPRQAIEAARAYARAEITEIELRAAAEAAWAATSAAWAWAAASAAWAWEAVEEVKAWEAMEEVKAVEAAWAAAAWTAWAAAWAAAESASAESARDWQTEKLRTYLLPADGIRVAALTVAAVESLDRIVEVKTRHA